FYVIYLLAVVPGDARLSKRFANLPGEVRERFNIVQRQCLAVIIHNEEPVAAPGYIAAHRPVTWNINHHAGRSSVAWNIRYCHLSVVVEIGFDDADRSFDPVTARTDALQVRERNHETNCAVAAHAQIADVVEEDHAGFTRRTCRFAEQ